MILAFIARALALDWWVQDVQAADATRVTLVQLWPAGPFVVRYGPPSGLGAWYADGTLHLVLPDGERTGPAGPDPAEQVVLARSWLREAPRRRTPADWRYQLAFLGGTGVTLDTASAPIHLAAEGSANDRMLLLTTTLTADLAAVRAARSGEAVQQERGLGERLHWWRTIARRWSFGVGGAVQLDAPGASWSDPWMEVGDDRYFRPEVTTSLELGVAWTR
jgi:hypothetical protein